MSTYTVTHFITRNDEDVEIEATGEFDGYGLDIVEITTDITLTPSEMDDVRTLLYDEKALDWDENKWESNR